MTSPLIHLRGVEKSYPVGPGRTWVLRRIDLDVRRGEFVTIQGPSGAGKTTLLSILGMLDGEFEGEYRFQEEPVHELKPRRRQELARRHIGFIFQQYHLLDDLTVAENLELPLCYRDVERSRRQALVADALDRFRIVGKKDLFPSQLSGGQQQLVAVARAVIGEPDLILADEPTGSLHSSQGERIMELLARLHDEGTTIVQVTHDGTCAAYGDRIVKLFDGWIRTEDEEGT
ncbi:MAG: ABC transporter ATP-binding protein [Thermoanaerobaculia bacterium]|nr:ABC transporter ATP-binding protein [Thermoanaerobaculia bacterium]